jgi:hypothetical protein
MEQKTYLMTMWGCDQQNRLWGTLFLYLNPGKEPLLWLPSGCAPPEGRSLWDMLRWDSCLLFHSMFWTSGTWAFQPIQPCFQDLQGPFLNSSFQGQTGLAVYSGYRLNLDVWAGVSLKSGWNQGWEEDEVILWPCASSSARPQSSEELQLYWEF